MNQGLLVVWYVVRRTHGPVRRPTRLRSPLLVAEM